jgi:hypothetical protein
MSQIPPTNDLPQLITELTMSTFAGLGVGLVRDSSTLMVAQYFKRKRELVEVVVVSG